MINSELTASEFSSLEPRLQGMLYAKLRDETMRLRGIEEKWDRIKENCPDIDTQILLCPQPIQRSRMEIEAQSIWEDELWVKWWYVSAEEAAGVRAIPEILPGTPFACNTRWTGRDLTLTSSESDHGAYTYEPRVSSPNVLRSPHGISRRISSQLLFHRLTLLFGMPPRRVMRITHISSWEIELNLQYHDAGVQRFPDGFSRISFRDYRGAPEVRFFGTAAASEDALDLINYLLGMTCAYNYHDIYANIAG